MNIYREEKDIIVSDLTDFDLKQVLECGQCFNFIRLEENEKKYGITAKGRYLKIEQKENILRFYDTSLEDYKNIWENYFDLSRNYGVIKKKILAADDRLEQVIKANCGIRILNQDFFETLISFIISQNKQIPQIKQVVRNISKMCGEKVQNTENEDTYLFPTIDRMMSLTEEDLRACKTGFRAPYIMDAVNKVASSEISEKSLLEISTEDARRKLMTIKGVGEKVANCVLLFGLGRREAFPVDVWMKRIMEELYFGKETKKEVIESYAYDKFGKYAGYAQQYLFIYGKEAKIGTKK